MDKDASKSELPRDEREDEVQAKPPVDLHDPFGRFNFEPTDGGEF